jgi:hypothetical protein
VRRWRHIWGLSFGLLSCCASVAAAPAGAVEPPPAPAWSVDSLALPTNFAPGDATGPNFYRVVATNVGGAPTDGSPIKIVDTLPPEVTVKGNPALKLRYGASSAFTKDFGATVCAVEKPAAQVIVTCTIPTEYSPPTGDEPSRLGPSEEVELALSVVVGAGVAEGTTLLNQVLVEGGGAPTVSDSFDNRASSQPAPKGFSYFRAQGTGPAGEAVTQAASHPFQYRFDFVLNTNRSLPGAPSPFVPAGGDPKDLKTRFPLGLIGNPAAAEQCTAREFNTRSAIHFTNPFGNSQNPEVNECPDGSAVGLAVVRIEGQESREIAPIYNLVPPPGMPAQLGFFVRLSPVTVHIDAEVRPDDHYRLSATVHNASQVKRITAGSITIWGTPGDTRHDQLRGRCLGPYMIYSVAPGPPCAAGGSTVPLWRLPTSCTDPLNILMDVDLWSEPGSFFSALAPGATPTGCDQVPFEPALNLAPTSTTTDSPTGLDVHVHIPQPQAPEELGEADLRDTDVTLPPGLVVNPSGANGLASCSEAQVGYLGKDARGDLFSDDPAACPGEAKIGTVRVNSPLVDHLLEGGIYVATPHENPFGSLLAIYVAVYDPETGIVIKLPGEVRPDAETGQLTTSFDDTPQLPFEDFELHFFAGPGAALRTPQICGGFSVTSSMTPWSAPDSGPPATPSDSFTLAQAAGGGTCPTASAQLPNAPAFEAGTEAAVAGASSPMVINLRREDGSQEFSRVTLTPPPGLLARLKGIPYCPDAALAAAAGKSGAAEVAGPSCPAASRVGTVTVGAGAGLTPYYVHGAAYLAGPYKGAPLSLAIITPAAAGPYDLGNVVVRTALQIDPETARITAEADPIPRVLEGIPLDVRSISIKLDHAGWAVTPTNCQPLEFIGSELSVLGQSAPLSNLFQVGGCSRLRFKPKLKLELKGATKRNHYPALKAALTYPKKGAYANIARAQVGLPHAEFLEQGHIDTVCTQPQLAARNCPKGSIYGHAKAWSPLLEKPLEGPVYLGTGYGHKLPDLVADLDGQIRILLHGRIDTTKEQGLRNTFEVVPDAPVSRFVLTMKGGKKGLLVNSENICGKKNRANAQFVAQNGKRVTLHPVIGNSCKQR